MPYMRDPNGQVTWVGIKDVPRFESQGWTLGGQAPGFLAPEELGPYTQYLTGMGLGGGFGDIGQRYLAKLYDPLRSVYQMAESIRGAEGGPQALEPLSWQDYMYQRRIGAGEPNRPWGGAQDIYGLARGALNRLLRLAPESRAEQELTFEPAFEAGTGAGAGGNLGALGNLLALAMGGGLAGRWAGGNIGNVQQSWLSARGRGEAGLPTNFLDYLRQRYGL